MNFLALTSSCSDPALGVILGIVKNVLNVIQILGPIVSIAALIYHVIMLLKNPDDKKAFNKIKNSAIALVLLFMVPVIINAVMGLLDDSTTFSDCWNNAEFRHGSEWIDPNSGKGKTNIYDYSDSDSYENGTPQVSPTASSSNTNSNVNNNSNSQSGTGNRTGSGNLSSNRVVFLGDSRTVQMYAYLNNDWTGANYSSGGVHEVGDDIYVAEGSMGLNWLKNTGIPAAEKYFNSGTAIVILMGVNDLFNANNYIKYVNENVSNWKKNGSSLYFVSVNPCTGDYSYLNTQIIDFNATVKNGLSNDVGWIDTYSQLNSNNLTSTDGLHYGKNTYQIIYNYIKSNV